MLIIFAGSAIERTGYAQDNKIIIGETISLRSAILNEERTLQISPPAGITTRTKGTRSSMC